MTNLYTSKSTHIGHSGAPPKETLLCIHMWDVASAKATNLVDGIFRSPVGLKCRSMTWPTGGPPKINYGKTILWKNPS